MAEGNNDIAASNMPQAYVRYMVFDEQLQPKSGMVQMAEGAGAWQEVGKGEDIQIERPGYVMVFTASKSPAVVYWDKVKFGTTGAMCWRRTTTILSG